MRNKLIRPVGLLSTMIALSSLYGCSDPSSQMVGEAQSTVFARQIVSDDVIAKVGDEPITFSQLNTMLNSSAMVGLSIPSLGSPERNKVIITLLDKAISANLLYLDAKQQGTNRSESYTSDVKAFEDAVLASMYKSKILIGDILVSEKEIQNFYTTSIDPGTEFTDDVKLAIEAKIRQQKLDKLKVTLRERLRADVEVRVNEDVVSTDHDGERSDDDVVVMIAMPRGKVQSIRWADVRTVMRGADYRASLAEFYIDNNEERMKRLQATIDNTLMAVNARASGLEQDPEFIRRTAEYRKTRLINIHRTALINGWHPSDDGLRGWFKTHKDSIAVPEARKIQMVVLKTKREAEDVKAKIDSGKITMFQAAQQFSIDPSAKTTLGEMGWVSHGTGFSKLDDFTFSLEPDVLAGPVESAAGWHLVKVLDVRDAQFQDIDDPATRKLASRMYMKEQLNNYVVDLRKNHFKVAVYNDTLIRRFQKQANYIASLNKKAVQEGSLTKQRQQELDKWIVSPVQ